VKRVDLVRKIAGFVCLFVRHGNEPAKDRSMWILACSGPGAAATIGRNIAFAEQQAIVVGGITALSLLLWLPFNLRIRYPAFCLLLLSFHPAWSMSATKGDCGDGMASNALWASLLALAALIMQIRYVAGVRRSRVRQPRQPSV
jgi:hypothetical protein